MDKDIKREKPGLADYIAVVIICSLVTLVVSLIYIHLSEPKQVAIETTIVQK